MLESTPYSMLANTVAFCKGSLRPCAAIPQGQGFSPLSITYLPVRIAFSTWGSFTMNPQSTAIPSGQQFRMRNIDIAAFINAINHVSSLCSFPEVCRVTTGPDVARMQHLHLRRWPAAMVKKETGDMCPVMEQDAILSDLKLSIAILMHARCPQPALVWSGYGYFAPKAFFERLGPTYGRYRKRLALPTTIGCFFETRGGDLKRFATRFVGTDQAGVFSPAMPTCQLRTSMRAIPHASFCNRRFRFKGLAARLIGTGQRDATFFGLGGNRVPQITTGTRTVDFGALLESRRKYYEGLATGFPRANNWNTVDRLNHQTTSLLGRCDMQLGPRADRATQGLDTSGDQPLPNHTSIA